MKKLILITDKELTDTFSKKIFISFILFLVVYTGYLNFISLEIYTGISAATDTSPQLIMSADPNQGIVAPLLSNFFLLFLFLFPLIVASSISSEKSNKTYDILNLNFTPLQILTGKFLTYFILAALLIIVILSMLIPYIFTGGFVDISYIINIIIGFFIFSIVIISISLFISSVTQLNTSFYIVIIINFLFLGIDFISEIINLNWINNLKILLPTNFYDRILSGIFDLKFYVIYLFISIYFFIITLLKMNRRKNYFYFISTIIFIIILIITSRIDTKIDMTFNKINSLSKESIKILNKIKDKKIEVDIYIKEKQAKWQTANDLIKLYKMSYNNICFYFLDPEKYGYEYGTIKFICDNREATVLSIDEDIFTKKIFYVATGQNIHISVRKENLGYPYKFNKSKKILYLLWIMFIIILILISRKMILRGGKYYEKV